MELLNKLLKWLSLFPFWARCLILALLSAVVVLMSLFAVSACGTPKTVATVQNVNPNSAVTVSMTVSNSTSSDVTPNIDIQHGTNSH